MLFVQLRFWKEESVNSAVHFIFIISSLAQPPRVASVSSLTRFLEKACEPHVLCYVSDNWESYFNIHIKVVYRDQSDESQSG